jgi:protein-disulfide isomerase
MGRDKPMTHDPTEHVIGAADARLTILEYGDFECPHCRNARPTVDLLRKRFHGLVRFAFRHYPLEEVHPQALLAAQAAEAAGAQGRFWLMHDLLFADQAHLGFDHLRRRAEHLELDIPRFVHELTDKIHLQRVREHIEFGKRHAVRGAPTFFVNDRICDVSFGLGALLHRVEEVASNQITGTCGPA